MGGPEETRDGVGLTSLDGPLFDGADATKRDLVDYLDALSDRIVPVLAGRPLSVVRVRPGQAPFMQKNLPRTAPDWVARETLWAHSSRREISYPLCNDRRTLLWLANQRAVEYHPTLGLAGELDRPTHLVLDLDPPDGRPDTFGLAVRAAGLVREVLTGLGLAAAVKTSGAKGVHVFVPLRPSTAEDVAAATRALAARAERLDPALATTEFVRADRGGKVFLDSTRAGGATVVAAWSPRIRPGVPVSFPVPWSELDRVDPRQFTVRTVPGMLGPTGAGGSSGAAGTGAGDDPWSRLMPEPVALPEDLVAQGREIPIARVAAMHEGKRRAARDRRR